METQGIIYNQTSWNDSLFYRVSLAESLLNEYYKEESVYKAMNILKEIFNSDIEKNSKNILNIILSKLIDLYIKTNNRIRLLINGVIFTYRHKFENTFINKDVSDKIISLILCSDCIARCFSIQLISYLPTLLETRLDLLHYVYNLLVSEKSLKEEKIIVMKLFENVVVRSVSENIEELIIDNFDYVMKMITCSKCKKSNNCEKCICCFEIKTRFLCLISKIRNIKINNVLFKYFFFENNCRKEYFKISVYALSIIVGVNKANLNYITKILNNVNQGENKENDNTNYESNIIYIVMSLFNFINLHTETDYEASDLQINCISFIEDNYDLFYTFTVNNIEKCHNFNISNAILLINLNNQNNHGINETYSKLQDYFFTPPNSNSNSNPNIQNNNKFLSLEKIIRILYITVNILNSKNNKNNKIIINQNYLKYFLNNLLKISHDRILEVNDGAKFFNSENIKITIDVIFSFFENNSLSIFFDLLIEVLKLNFTNLISNFENKKEYLYYIYFLDLLLTKFTQKINKSEKIINYIYNSFVSILLVNKHNNDLDYLNKNLIKLSKKHLEMDIEISMDIGSSITPLTNKSDIILEYILTKEYLIINDIPKSKEHCIKLITINNWMEEYFNRVFLIQSIMNTTLVHMDRDKENVTSLLDTHFKFQIDLLEKISYPLPQFSKDFISGLTLLFNSLTKIKDCLSNDSSFSKIYDILDSITDSSLIIYFLMENKINMFIDLKMKTLKNNIKYHLLTVGNDINNLLLHFSKYLVVINPIFNIQISDRAIKSNIDNLYVVPCKIIITNLNTYFANTNSIYISVFLNFNPVKEIEIKTKSLSTDTDKVIDKVTDFSLFYTKKNPSLTEEVILTYTFTFIHEEFYKFIFYEHTSKHLI